MGKLEKGTWGIEVAPEVCPRDTVVGLSSSPQFWGNRVGTPDPTGLSTPISTRTRPKSGKGEESGGFVVQPTFWGNRVGTPDPTGTNQPATWNVQSPPKKKPVESVVNEKALPRGAKKKTNPKETSHVGAKGPEAPPAGTKKRKTKKPPPKTTNWSQDPGRGQHCIVFFSGAPPLCRQTAQKWARKIFSQQAEGHWLPK